MAREPTFRVWVFMVCSMFLSLVSHTLTLVSYDPLTRILSLLESIANELTSTPCPLKQYDTTFTSVYFLKC
jgi:hypothetical protein